MALRSFVADLSAVDPADQVTSREFHQFDNASPPNEVVYILAPDVTSWNGSIDDTAAPGSCYLVDVNAAGQSSPSPSVPLVPPPAPAPGPTPTPTGVPKTPAIKNITFVDTRPGK